MIRMKTQYAGPAGCFSPGQIVADFSKAEEKQLIDGGYAEPIAADAPPTKGKRKPETAANPGAEQNETAAGPGSES